MALNLVITRALKIPKGLKLPCSFVLSNTKQWPINCIHLITNCLSKLLSKHCGGRAHYNIETAKLQTETQCATETEARPKLEIALESIRTELR